MDYICVKWIHDFNDESILLYSEINSKSKEIRKIEEFRNGIVGYADKNNEINGSRLLEGRMPTIEEFAADRQFIP